MRGSQSLSTVYNAGGIPVLRNRTDREISLNSMPRGIYFAWYKVDDRQGILKVIVQ